jgi:hypothetical protein
MLSQDHISRISKCCDQSEDYYFDDESFFERVDNRLFHSTIIKNNISNEIFVITYVRADSDIITQ